MATQPAAATQESAVVFFDGVCGLCNWSVDWILSHDRRGFYKFAPLQGDAAARYLEASDREDLDSVVVLKNTKLYRRSDAVVEVLREMPPPWNFLGVGLGLIPGSVRDFGYRLVAKNRYRLFGKRETCRLPTRDERARFID
jgi:predicted DCC family thiol-disulfide oxidoreductase YuxK